MLQSKVGKGYLVIGWWYLSVVIEIDNHLGFKVICFGNVFTDTMSENTIPGHASGNKYCYQGSIMLHTETNYLELFSLLYGLASSYQDWFWIKIKLNYLNYAETVLH